MGNKTIQKHRAHKIESKCTKQKKKEHRTNKFKKLEHNQEQKTKQIATRQRDNETTRHTEQ
jgi:hypothetical protein